MSLLICFDLFMSTRDHTCRIIDFQATDNVLFMITDSIINYLQF